MTPLYMDVMKIQFFLALYTNFGRLVFTGNLIERSYSDKL